MMRLMRPGLSRVVFQGVGVKSAYKPQVVLSMRFLSDDIPKEFNNVTDSVPVVDPITIPMIPSLSSTDPSVVDALTSTAAVAVANIDDANYVVGTVMKFIDYVHTLAGVPYWEAIVFTTVGLRFLLLPVVLKTTQSSARLAVARPEMQKVQEAMAKDTNTADSRVQLKYQKEMSAVLSKHKVNPVRALLWPVCQFPIFIAFFMALRDMGTYFPGFLTGGDFWFTNLSAPDSFYYLPIANSVSFLLMIELGADGMPTQQQATFRWVMRGLAVALVPLTSSMPQGLFVYWVTNNVFSLVQTMILKQESVRKALDIPKIPTENTPNLKVVNPFKKIGEVSCVMLMCGLGCVYGICKVCVVC
ncbi:YidC/Oxa1 family membrane protein insertase [archaeon]|nr:MAG: YidC/Oxa1 family membrane protein insertase [archaeon]